VLINFRNTNWTTDPTLRTARPRPLNHHDLVAPCGRDVERLGRLGDGALLVGRVDTAKRSEHHVYARQRGISLPKLNAP
jgi:hypothetical protein